MKLFNQISAMLFVLFLPTAALAHHPLAGSPMQSFSDGLLSGIGHPILGFDHLFFVILMGIAAVFTGHKFASPAAYLTTMLIGCFLVKMGINLPLTELVIALSLLCLGIIVLSGKSISSSQALILFAGFGLFHGAAFGDSISTQEAGLSESVFIAYLIGLGCVQYLISVATSWMVSSFLHAKAPNAIKIRLAGAMVAGAGRVQVAALRV